MSRRVAMSARLRALDVRDRYLSRPPRADRLVPPRRLQFVGHSDFVETGEEFAGHLERLVGLRPSDAVLDVGCGIGRMARPLTRVLDPQAGGRYDGFDVNVDGIGWCRRRYRRHPHFRFRVADLFNARYNPGGTHTAADYRFPYPSGSFDVVLCTSVLTHLLEAEADHYLAEIARCLKPGGRVLATFFLLNDTSRTLIEDGVAHFPFLDAEEEVAILDEAMPEEAVAYADEWVFRTLRRHGLTLIGLHPGSWCGREEHLSFQDVIVAEREAYA
ncbi:class I SAM-dependent methyltransferase [Paraconexibacter algicola]|nr:class I SAM-dependent methyltransferase [Paraconexibacter algicola]